MSLSTGQSLGPYTIVAPLGAGGMGEVYRARDARLNRDVAIKIVPPAVAGNAEALARFERESRAVAALSHPNILTIFDVGQSNGHPYSVMELLEGETLRARIAHGPLPVRKAVEIAAHIARGLAAAHDKQIAHRDLKPDNVFLTPTGGVKILDFGLARNTSEQSDLTRLESPTMGPATTPGTVLGTVGYMSPEQVRGEPSDHRSDIFALGCVLYEMLTGQRAYKRDTAAETMSAILREDPPDPSTLNITIPASRVADAATVSREAAARTIRIGARPGVCAGVRARQQQRVRWCRTAGRAQPTLAVRRGGRAGVWHRRRRSLPARLADQSIRRIQRRRRRCSSIG